MIKWNHLTSASDPVFNLDLLDITRPYHIISFFPSILLVYIDWYAGHKGLQYTSIE